MKHTINYIVALLALSLALISCSREAGLKMDEGAGNTVRFSIESSLRAVGNENATRPTPALDRERKIESLYAVVYRTSSGLHYKTIKCTDKGGGQFEFDNEKSGEFYFFLVANPNDALVAKLMEGPSTPDDLGMLVATQTPGENNQATNFLMTSERQNVTVKSKESTNLGPIKLVRVAARFDIYNNIEGLKITKVTFGKRRVQSHLFAQVGKMDGIEATENEKVYDGSLFKENTLAATIYGYETDVRNETFFTIEATYNGIELKPETVRLENFVIKRNHLYNIILLHNISGSHEPEDPTMKFGQFQYTVKVVDWNDSEKGINYSEDNILKPFYVDFSAQISNAPYMTPYLINSPEDVYTTTKGASEVTITVGGYIEPGTLAFAEGFDNTINATLTDLGNPTTDPKTGKISHSYKLSIPAMDDYVPVLKGNKLALPGFEEIPLVAKNYSGATIKNLTVKHGRFKMPLEYVSEHYLAPHTEGEEFKFATDETDIKNVGYFKTLEFAQKNADLTVAGEKYHIPYHYYELCSLFPFRNTKPGLTTYSVGKNSGPVDNAVEYMSLPCWAVALQGADAAIVTVKSDYRTDKANNVSYGLRFKSSNKGYKQLLVMAYRYQWIGDFKPNINGKVSSYYKVTSRYLGANWNGTIKEIANEAFWNANTEQDVTRNFYAVGSIDEYFDTTPQDKYRNVNNRSYFFGRVFFDDTRDKNLKPGNKRYVHTAILGEAECHSNGYADANRGKYTREINRFFPVRLFSDK